ncbi:hypothetical protein [Lysobacter gummosus]
MKIGEQTKEINLRMWTEDASAELFNMADRDLVREQEEDLRWR